MTTTVDPPPAATDAPQHRRVLRTRPPRILEPSFSGVGLVVGAFFISISLLPSLLPRLPAVQGVASAISFLIGYALGASAHAVWNYLEIPNLRRRAALVVGGVLMLVVAVLTGLAIWQWVGWQNEIRDLYGMSDLNPTAWPLVVGIGLLTAAVLLIIARAIRLLFRAAFHLLDRWLPHRLAITLGTAVTGTVLYLAISGLLVQGFFAASNAGFSLVDSQDKPGVEQTTSELRSGGPGSAVAWEDLGRQGRSFISSGPTASDLDDYWGSGSMEPIRAYVGLRSADSLDDRANLLLEELIRTGAFDRKAIVLGTVTGTGYLDPRAVDTLDYLFKGDVAIAGVQYSYLPSWISILADQEITRDTSQTVFRTVYDFWATLPEDDRPDIYLYGLSLGSYGVEAVLGSVDILNEEVAGALMSGPTFVNPLHSELVAARNEGSTVWQPVVGDGRTVRFMSQPDALSLPTGEWGETRVVYLQHGSDPVGMFSPTLAWSQPAWLEGDARAPDVSPRMDWFPLVTMWQVLLDMPGSGSVPDGYGHMYSHTENLRAWVGITQPEGWTEADTDALAEFLEARALDQRQLLGD
ncbi:alpha/beta hydrolase [Demequina zhanjiangensis]|uniref:Alpha/beta-hydrolase family protein n=1 Tax=Demequina zhanjiangensis TaxID=3051659 RepID=A0ABT8G2Q1_9MICO|nr:alpha/beta-hydrolase family protein [Demequina sp. SYSU T00b26]MDN4473431.1 alpha/beta-hydrolase family protein [Demequina sp. SYSU T00b26]